MNRKDLLTKADILRATHQLRKGTTRGADQEGRIFDKWRARGLISKPTVEHDKILLWKREKAIQDIAKFGNRYNVGSLSNPPAEITQDMITAAQAALDATLKRAEL